MLRPDDKIGPYTLLRTLGRGAFGEVWLAEKRSSLLTTRVALKLPLVAENEGETLRQEAALWLQASGHPNIVPVLDAEVYDGQVVIASEFIAGGSLHEWMQANAVKTPSLEDAVSMANGILAGLDYLHRSGLTHRDLKPENVLLQDGIPRLTDFGLARVLKTEAQTGTISGTPRYMAPETFSGSYSAASDLWAVGVLLYELLTGSHPFPPKDMMALIVAIQSQEPIPLPDSIPERLRYIVTRLLAKAPSERFASASAVREALQNCLQPVASVAVIAQDAPALPPHNLPVQPTSFIGREKQIAELRGLLEHTHLLTLTGSGGCGKTRLSLQVAEEVLENFPDGVWLVELAPLTDPALMPNTVANVLGIKETPGETITQSLLAALKNKQLLLVLDNCEHLLDVAARLVDAILKSCPKVQLLVSSREALGIAWESAYRVPSLSLPDPKHPETPDNLFQYEAVRLFTERAVAAKSDFVVTNENASGVASVCHRLDGIPLAIELAAARVRSMSIEQIEARLDDRFRLLSGGSRTALARQQTLRALIDWSYDLLSGSERMLLNRLWVFTGGWTLEAAEAVCAGRDLDEWQVLDLLTSLVDKSLVVYEERTGTGRYRLLETIRQYARQKIADDSQDVRHRHLHFFLALAEEVLPHLYYGAEQRIWYQRLEREHDNLRAALEWSLASDAEEDAALRLVGALGLFWLIGSHFREAREWTDRALASRHSVSPLVMAWAFQAAGVSAFFEGDLETAATLAEKGLQYARAAGSRWLICFALFHNAMNALNLRQPEKALASTEEGMTLAREEGDPWLIGRHLFIMGLMAWMQRDYAASRALLEESVNISRKLDDVWFVGMLLSNLGFVVRRDGDCQQARALYREGLKLCQRFGDRRGVAWDLIGMAGVEVEQDHTDRAATLLGAATAILQNIGSPLPPPQQMEHDRDMERTQSVLGAGSFAAAFGKGQAMTLEQVIEYAIEESEASTSQLIDAQ